MDIEQVRADYPVDCVAELFFSDQEQARFRSLPACLRRRAFFACWCRKEAMVKALGYGLPLGLDRLEVSMASGGTRATVVDARSGRKSAGVVNC